MLPIYFVSGATVSGLQECLHVKMPYAKRGIEFKIPEVETFHTVHYAFGYWHPTIAGYGLSEEDLIAYIKPKGK